MNQYLELLHPYPFTKLATLKAGIIPPSDKTHIALSIGEPQSPTPDFIKNAIIDNVDSLNSYPLSKGMVELRAVIVDWLIQRFELSPQSLDPQKHVLPVNGSREALFAFAQCVVDNQARNPLVLMTNPFYQIYEGAALLAGARPSFIASDEKDDFIPDFDQVSSSDWDDCQLLYICSPNNPTGKVLSIATLQKLISLSLKHDFIIACDECYSEIYLDEERKPPGLLQAASSMGHDSYKNCMVFHSLSKRSNAPGLRSGFVAGDAALIEKFLLYRTYHGSAMPLHHQYASIKAWSDEHHVIANRQQYREKFTVFLSITGNKLQTTLPDGGFYLWAKTPIADTEFTKQLYTSQNITVLPGSFMSRTVNGDNPGTNYIRIALVADKDECIAAAERINHFLF